ncbi:MAG: hypothetical protein IH949_06305, partial [Bacteroidetes bacterium]|nr:hypothetical protein [Bacteroidota bacterium]
MNRLYKPFLILTYLLLFGAFTSTSLGQAVKPFSTNAAGTITLSTTSNTVGEDGASVTLTATADQAPNDGVTITVTIVVAGGTAIAGDFDLASLTITIVGDGGGNLIG